MADCIEKLLAALCRHYPGRVMLRLAAVVLTDAGRGLAPDGLLTMIAELAEK
ncbi:hypothetical protein [Aquisalimonas sp.]|uniref:hypothetical protein n=1 Tax=Aquisalimonas sp. TaxID=1872621 RepID=UPI0025BD348D|nr:hypothetical protein [Aquisalimonas sp.]